LRPWLRPDIYDALRYDRAWLPSTCDQGFADAETERIWNGRRSRRLPLEIQPLALRKLRMLNQVRTLADLRLPPGNRLEMLNGARRGQYSIRINRQWRICFRWQEGRPRMSRSSTTTTDPELLPHPHPGEILAEEFMRPLGLSQNALARSLHVPPLRINELVQGKRAVTADTDLRLARYFGTSEGFFLGLQGRGRPHRRS
jgi:addiction module HigA family antidote